MESTVKHTHTQHRDELERRMLQKLAQRRELLRQLNGGALPDNWREVILKGNDVLLKCAHP